MANNDNARVSNRDIYEAIDKSRKELIAKIDRNRDQGVAMDLRLARLEVKVDNITESDKVAVLKAKELEMAVHDLQLDAARSNKVAAGIAAGVSAAINAVAALWQAMK